MHAHFMKYPTNFLFLHLCCMRAPFRRLARQRLLPPWHLGSVLPIIKRRWLSTSDGKLDAIVKHHQHNSNWDTNSYSLLLRECSLRRWGQAGRWVHAHMVCSGFPYLKLGNKLVDFYLKCGSVTDARKVFDEMPKRHVVAWNAMITAYTQLGRYDEVLRMFLVMHHHYVVADEFTYTGVFKACTGSGYALLGRAAHCMVVVIGLKPNVFVGSAAIDMYMKCRRIKDARFLFDSMEERDVVLWTALVVGYVQNEKDMEALSVFNEMVHSAVEPNEYTLSSVLIACGNLIALRKGLQIHAIVIKRGFELDVSACTSLLSMYSKCGSPGDSYKVFEAMAGANVVAWTAMITGLVQNGQQEAALSAFRGMMVSLSRPNQFTFSIALRACASAALLDEGKQIHMLIHKTGFVTNSFASAALVDMYGKCGFMEMARKVLDNQLLLKDIVLINAVISGYAQNGNGEEAILLFEEMKQLGISPNSGTFVGLLSACSNSGMLEEGRKLFYLMSSLDIQHNKDHYGCMVDLLGRAGQLEEAQELINSMTVPPDAVIWRTLLSACRIHGNIEIGKRAAQFVMQLEEGDEGTHILLSNIYASMNNWSEVSKIKSNMRRIGLKKDPALSWIEVNHKVHVFVAGDRSHHRREEIYAELEDLILRAKEVGYIPDTSFVLQDLEEEMKERSLYEHSEKLTIVFGLLCLPQGIPIRIFKNLRVCGDCHNWIKFISRIVHRDIIARDAKRFHHFKGGVCSCGEYW